MHGRPWMIALVAGAMGLMGVSGEAKAQNDAVPGAIFGGVAGALIGGAVSGKAGGAVAGALIGGTTGAIVGSQVNRPPPPPPAYYFWNGNRCFYRYPNGQVIRVTRGYCQ